MFYSALVIVVVVSVLLLRREAVLRGAMSSVLLVCSLCVFAQPIAVESKQLTTHYIIAFDQYVGGYNHYFDDRNILQRVDEVLNRRSFDGERDYVSVVGYGLSDGKPEIEYYSRPYVVAGESVLWCHLDDSSLRDFFGSSWGRLPSLPGTPYSMQSMAVPFSVLSARSDGEDHYADRTVLLVVTDDVMNGQDHAFNNEWNAAASVSPGINVIRGIVETRCNEFNARFNDHKVDETTISKACKDPYKIVIYEIEASNKVSIHSVSSMPGALSIRRVRGGYKFRERVRSKDERYVLQTIRLSDSSGKLLCTSKDGVIDISLDPGKYHSGDSVRVDMSLLYKDGLYDGFRLSYRNPAYNSGLSASLLLYAPAEAKVLGVLPLEDIFWWWYPNDQFAAVMVWDVILLLIFIVLVAWVFYKVFVRINAYTPKNDDIKINKV